MSPRVAGLDEAGCGPAFGDLVAAAVVLPTGFDTNGLADSKSMSEGRRRDTYNRIVQVCAHGVGRITNVEIDSRGLAWARREVFHRALDDLERRSNITPDSLIVDGTLFAPWKSVPYECIPKADANIPCVSAASIVAKVERDASIYAICKHDTTLDARYGLCSNKGYLSPQHKDGLRKHGLTQWHRHSYNIKL